ncbi:ABC transporter ATP-binding protein [Streptomyces cellulosae]
MDGTSATEQTRGTSATGQTRDGRSGGDAVVVTRGLTKRYRGGQLAVDDLHLTVPAGSVLGFLGPNGSGKTTTIRMLMGLIGPTSGTAHVLGRPMPRSARAVLPHVGALIEGPALYGFLSGRDNLLRYDAADPTADPRTRTARVAAALDRVGLTAASGKKARAYSLGLKQRLGLAAALLRPRRLLVLDEPTNGLDAQGMREIRALVRELATDGTTVFLAMATTVGLLITVQILDQIPQLHALHPYLFSHYWLSFADLMREPVYWDGLTKNLGLQALYAAVFGSAAWARFTTKDVTA